ncbi:MAG: hypothetical protein JW804_07110 [Sedimentisphaerales bacterium]|nr:hypothetical protein [Sedimentisphaerales bacterium]
MKRIRKNKGAALILAVLAMVLLLVTGGGLLTLGFQSRAYQIHTASDIAARCAADTAMTKALYEINTLFANGELGDELPTEADISLTGSESDYSYTITKDGSTYTITATGQSNGAQRTVEATLAASNPFDFAIFAQENISMKNSSKIDWYNYTAEDGSLKVGTNSTNNGAVELKNSTDIYGDVVVGAGGNPSDVVSTQGGAHIHGDTYAQSSNNTPPSVTVPASLAVSPLKDKIEDDKTLTSSDSGKYPEIDLGNSKTLTIKGPVELYVTGNITLNNSANIVIDDSVPGSSLTIYIAGNYEGKNSSEMNNNTEIPKKFKFYGLDTCTSLDFKNSSELYGIIYAPNADITFHNSVDIYGSIVGKNIELKNSANLNYDASLRDPTTDENLVTLTIQRWKE